MTFDRGRDATLIRADSAEEQVAYMLSRFGDPATWSVVSQRLNQTEDGRDTEVVRVSVGHGDQQDVAFVAADEENPFEPDASTDGTRFLDAVMEKASTFSQANPPHHPGTLARFPVPSASFAHVLAIPMAVLAVNEGIRGLFAPPRVVVVDFSTLDPIGVKEFPGFDPEDWPPPRLGDWPPAAPQGMHHLQVQGAIGRFSACWNRVLRAWFDERDARSVDLTADIVESLEIRGLLDLPAMLPFYDRLNPEFARWSRDHGVDSA